MRLGLEAVYFNTSHVSINHTELVVLLAKGEHFNTSHVSINRRITKLINELIYISIHLMFLLITLSCSSMVLFFDFNTSHVSINLVQDRPEVRAP